MNIDYTQCVCDIFIIYIVFLGGGAALLPCGILVDPSVIALSLGQWEHRLLTAREFPTDVNYLHTDTSYHVTFTNIDTFY